MYLDTSNMHTSFTICISYSIDDLISFGIREIFSSLLDIFVNISTFCIKEKLLFEIQEKDTTVIKGFNCNICEDYIYKDLMICWIVNCSISKVESVQFLLNALLQNLRCFFNWTSVIVLCGFKASLWSFQFIVVCLSMYIESLAYKRIIYFKIKSYYVHVFDP